MKIIKCSCGQDILLDDDDFDAIKRSQVLNRTWYCQNSSVMASIPCGNGKYKKMPLARFIITVRDGMEPDHINRNIHDHRKEFLREATKSQNKANRGMFKNNKSGFRGVSWTPRNSKWTAQITVNGKPKWLGYFNNKIEAARVYDKAALEHFGNFANLNFPNFPI